MFHRQKNRRQIQVWNDTRENDDIFWVNFPVSKLDYGISLQALEIAAWNVFKKPLPKYEIIVFVSYFYFVLGGWGQSVTKEMGKWRFNCKNTILDIVKCFHRMGKHETRNCDMWTNSNLRTCTLNAMHMKLKILRSLGINVSFQVLLTLLKKK